MQVVTNRIAFGKFYNAGQVSLLNLGDWSFDHVTWGERGKEKQRILQILTVIPKHE